MITDGGDRRCYLARITGAHPLYKLTREFCEPVSGRMVQKIVARWDDYSRLVDVSPHDLRRTAITRALDSGLS